MAGILAARSADEPLVCRHHRLDALVRLLGSEHGRRFGSRLMAQMPVIIAMGINFGIVPLLFIQVGFGQVFYPATILMAWFWFSVIVLLVPAYYGVYLYAYGLAGAGRANAPLEASRRLALGGACSSRSASSSPTP